VHSPWLVPSGIGLSGVPHWTTPWLLRNEGPTAIRTAARMRLPVPTCTPLFWL